MSDRKIRDRKIGHSRRHSYFPVCLSCLLAIFCFVPAALAQYRFDSWTADTGLPQNSINAIHQTRDGYLWLATSDGLVRFDGVRFTVFNKGNSPGIASNRFSCLYEDHRGDLWAGTDNGGVTRYGLNVFTTYTTRHGLPHNYIRGITGDESGNLWVLSANSIMQWQEVGERFLPALATQPKFIAGSPSFGSFGGFWGVDQTSLYRFAHGRLTTWTRKSGLPSLDIHAVAEDRQGTVWVATRDAGLARIKDGKVTHVYTTSDGLPTNLMWFVSGPDLKIACADQNGNLSIIGLDPWVKHSVLHPPPGLLERLDLNAPYLDITALYEDREGNLWIGTPRRGLYRVRKQVVTTYSKQHGLADDNVYPIYEDRAGAVWIGAWYAGVSRFKDGTFSNYTMREGLSSGLVTAISEDRDGRLWVAAMGDDEHGGLRILESFKHRRFRAFNKLAATGGQVSAICQDREGALWFGTQQGLAQYKNGKVATLTTKDGLAGDEVKVIIEGAKGNLWIGSYGGLTRFNDGKLTAWTEHDGLPSNSVRALYEDRDGALWIGTYDGGLGRFKDGRFTRYTTRQGLFNDGVFQILEDARGYFWIGCNRGIYRVSKQELNEFAAGGRSVITSIAYGRSDGLLNPECNGGRWPAGIRARDGRLWFPTQDGVAVIDPEAIPINSRPPPVIIESFLLDRAPVPFDRPVRIAPNQENFEIEYTALSFINPEHLKFKYKLEGLNHDWIDAGTRRTAYYSRVPPGSYTFKVIAANSDGVWNTEGRSLSVTVLPPFYRAWWFLTLAGLGVAGAVFLAYEYRVRQLKRARVAQQAFSRELIVSQEGERKRIAAELHDSLGQSLAIIKNRALLSLSTPDDHDRALDQLREISEASAQVIVEAKEIAHNLRPYQLDRLGLTRTIKGMIERVAETHDLRFKVELDDIDGLFPPESEINLFRIVQESVNNIVRHAEATDGRAMIKRNAHRVELIIADNGKGFTPGAARASGPLRRGFGLISIAERVRVLGGDYDIHSVPGKGTTMTITISIKDGQG